MARGVTPEWSTPVQSYARLEQIRVLPAREVTVLSAITSHHPILNFRTKLSLPRPPRCIIVSHTLMQDYLLDGRILIGRATDFHIEHVFRVNKEYSHDAKEIRLGSFKNSIFPHFITIF
jgi:hypothetical protein